MRKDILHLQPKHELPDTIHIGQLHYHLATAGVRVVMENSIDSIMTFDKRRKVNVFVIASAWAAPRPEDLKIRSDFKKKSNLEIKTIDIPELDYDSKHYKST